TRAFFPPLGAEDTFSRREGWAGKALSRRRKCESDSFPDGGGPPSRRSGDTEDQDGFYSDPQPDIGNPPQSRLLSKANASRQARRTRYVRGIFSVAATFVRYR